MMIPVIDEKRTTASDQFTVTSITVESGLNFFRLDEDLLGDLRQLKRARLLPEQLVKRYLNEALKQATVRKLESGEFFAEIPRFEGVWASDEDLGACGEQLRDVLLDWLVLKVQDNDRDLPIIGDINLNVL